MKTELDKSAREALITYRLEKSEETLREVDFLISGGFYSGAVSRLYYACYYAVVALLLKENIATLTHAGVKTAFSMHFVRTNKIDKQIAKTFYELFDLRHNNDYDDYTICDEATIRYIRPRADQFMQAVRQLI